MALPARFSLLESEFNEFLFATVGEERIGVPLSVLSALARLGLDPWPEAARLSDLPRESAVAALSGTIARLPVGRWEPSDTRGIAARLIEALPRRGSASLAGPAKAKGARRSRIPGWRWRVALGWRHRLPVSTQPPVVAVAVRQRWMIESRLSQTRDPREQGVE